MHDCDYDEDMDKVVNASFYGMTVALCWYKEGMRERLKLLCLEK